MAERKVRVLLGTRKGTYIVESDKRRRSWKVRPVAHTGNDVYHVTADPRAPGTLYAAVNNGFFGPILYRSTNWGGAWTEIGTPLTPASRDRPNPFESPSPPKWKITNLWHLQPGHASEPKTIFLGADPHLLFRSDDRGDSWQPVTSINEHPDRAKWNPGNGGPCLHTILIDPRNPKRMHIGMSAVGTLSSDDAGEHWRPTNEKVETPFLPEKFPEIGQCVHDVVVDAANPDVAYRQDHGGIYVHHHDFRGPWERVGKLKGGPKDDFGFGVTSPAQAPGRAYFVPLAGEGRVTPNGGLQVWEWNDTTRRWKVLMSPSKIPGAFGVLREGISSDSLSPAGIYVGTTTGQLVLSPDGGKSWQQVPYTFPEIRSVEAAV